MTGLTGKQKRFLRGLGQRLEPSVVLGKSGMTPAIVAAVGEQLSRRELIKVRLPAGPGRARRASAEALAAAAEASCAGVVGRTALLYRPNPDLPARERLALP